MFVWWFVYFSPSLLIWLVGCLCLCVLACFFAPWGTFWCCSGTLKGLWRLCSTLGDLGAPLWYLGPPVCHPWVHFGVFVVLLETSGEHFGTLGLHLGALLPPWGRALDPLGHFWAKAPKQVFKVTENGSQNVSQNRADKRFVAFFCHSFFENVFAVFRSGFLEEIVESRRRPMCV